MRSVANRISRAWADLFSQQEKKAGPQLVSPPKPTEPTPAATPDPQRCQFFFADGRRCRARHCNERPTLCLRHASAHLQLAQAVDLAPLSGEFTTATEINRALGKVFLLLAQNRIPRRNAVALGYLAQLMLQTLPGVREEITSCLGHKAWDETIEDALRADDGPADDTKAPETEAAAEQEPQAQTETIELRAQNKEDMQELPNQPGPKSLAPKSQPETPISVHLVPPAKSNDTQPTRVACPPDLAEMVVRGTHVSPDGTKIPNSTYRAPGLFPAPPVVARPAQPAAAKPKSPETNITTTPEVFRNEHLQKNHGRGSTNLLIPSRKDRRIWCGSGSPFRRPR